MAELTILLLLLLAGWFWADTMRAREAAIRVGKRLCEQDGLQLLDDTVAVAKLTVRRNTRGRMALRRLYQFEFSDTGNNRRNGTIVMLGYEVESTYLEPFRERQS